jgi:hypothetical protein
VPTATLAYYPCLRSPPRGWRRLAFELGGTEEHLGRRLGYLGGLRAARGLRLRDQKRRLCPQPHPATTQCLRSPPRGWRRLAFELGGTEEHLGRRLGYLRGLRTARGLRLRDQEARLCPQPQPATPQAFRTASAGWCWPTTARRALKGCATRPSRVFRAYRAGRLRDHEARLFLQPQLASAQFSVKGNLLSLPRKLP